MFISFADSGCSIAEKPSRPPPFQFLSVLYFFYKCCRCISETICKKIITHNTTVNLRCNFSHVFFMLFLCRYVKNIITIIIKQPVPMLNPKNCDERTQCRIPNTIAALPSILCLFSTAEVQFPYVPAPPFLFSKTPVPCAALPLMPCSWVGIPVPYFPLRNAPFPLRFLQQLFVSFPPEIHISKFLFR